MTRRGYESEELISPKKRSPGEWIVLYSDGIEAVKKNVDNAALLQSLQAAERRIKEDHIAKGIKYIGCGESRDGIIFGGSTEHLIEHAICDVLDILGNYDEESAGNTKRVGVRMGFSGLQSTYCVTIIPPPSIDLNTANRISARVLDALSTSRGNLNLFDLAEKIKSET